MSIALLRLMLNELNDLVVVLDQTGELVCASPKGSDMFSSNQTSGAEFLKCISTKEFSFFEWFHNSKTNTSNHFTFRCLEEGDENVFDIHAFIVDIDSMKYSILFLHSDQETIVLRKELVSKINAIEQLAKSQKIRDGKLQDAICEILKISSNAMNTSRVSIWRFAVSKDTIYCLGSYEKGVFSSFDEENLPTISKPDYFKLFQNEKIIFASDALSNELMNELKYDYLIPNDIQAMMDVPVRIEGEVIGVFCFEQVGAKRDWTLDDQKFGLISAQMVSLAIETSEKKKLQLQLEQTVKRQQNLFTESNHRVKNNLAIISSLINLQAQNCKDSYHENLFNDLQNRVLSIVSLHEMLNNTKSFETINLQLYLEDILLKLENSFALVNQKAIIVRSIESVDMEISKSIVFGLIVNEIITNSFKHAFHSDSEGVIQLQLFQESNGVICLKISDNGVGFDIQSKTNTLGIDILKDLVNQLDGELLFSSEKGARFEIRVKI